MKSNEIYIRTSDGVHLVNELEVFDGYHGLYGFVAKESKHLDELFNRVISINKGHYKIMTMFQFGKLSRNKVLTSARNGVVYYGACWTKNGLKYVSKLKQEDWVLL